ncbi:hypothetical protein ACFVHQ_17995 [Actinomycetes bacterium NPDC127524]|uniref:hypothetical protein n=1 Tax=Bacillus sp. MUM 13 TaxID=1678001 RepID=UPI0008F56503|nr:hypothetical protein [Bacillus sp. MUM 13]OIK08892.1 hypothetical protein BIV59_18555 [Bacillus sp. MUM 13]
MLNHQDKRRTFQEAQQSVKQVQDAYDDIITDSPGYGHQLQHLKQEANEAFQQIQTALGSASEHQQLQLEQFQKDISSILSELNAEG